MKLNISERLFKKEAIQRCKLDECHAACCLHGVWLDCMEKQDLIENSALITPFMPEMFQDVVSWFEEKVENDIHSVSGKVVHSTVLPDESHYGESACIFLMSDHKCALQVAGEKSGLHPWRFKPFYCILHPLDIDDEGRITLDATHLLLEEPASCLRPSLVPGPIIEIFEEELRYLLGDLTYKLLVEKRIDSG